MTVSLFVERVCIPSCIGHRSLHPNSSKSLRHIVPRVIDSISSVCLLFKKKHVIVQSMMVVYYQQQEVLDNNQPATDKETGLSLVIITKMVQCLVLQEKCCT